MRLARSHAGSGTIMRNEEIKSDPKNGETRARGPGFRPFNRLKAFIRTANLIEQF